MRMRWILPLIALCALTATAGCSLPDPYVYRDQEFNRDLRTFGKDLTDISSVAVCYNKKNATPQQIVQMAQAECAKYGRIARFYRQRLLYCPITTPIQAVYVCERQGQNDPFAYLPSRQ